jgi:hypothetical protein
MDKGAFRWRELGGKRSMAGKELSSCRDGEKKKEK